MYPYTSFCILTYPEISLQILLYAYIFTIIAGVFLPGKDLNIFLTSMVGLFVDSYPYTFTVIPAFDCSELVITLVITMANTYSIVIIIFCLNIY